LGGEGDKRAAELGYVVACGAIAYALSDRIVEAREAMARLREIDPTLRLSNLERVAPPLRRPEDRARFADGLRRAGLPE